MVHSLHTPLCVLSDLSEIESSVRTGAYPFPHRQKQNAPDRPKQTLRGAKKEYTGRVYSLEDIRRVMEFRRTFRLATEACGIIFTLGNRTGSDCTGDRNSGYTHPVIYTGRSPGRCIHDGKSPDLPY